jgi:hypothetical protein
MNNPNIAKCVMALHEMLSKDCGNASIGSVGKIAMRIRVRAIAPSI